MKMHKTAVAGEVDLESEILARSFRGGFGTKWIARRLPNVSFEARFEIEEPTALIAGAVDRLLTTFGKPVPELVFDASIGVFGAIVGSGVLNLNPTIVLIQLESAGPRTTVFVRAVAKEGLIKQHSARSAVERIKAALESFHDFARASR
jgi:hypothetical protein